VNLVAADSVLAVGDHPHSHQPLIEADRRVFKDCSDLDGELAFGMPSLALPYPASWKVFGIGTSAGRANYVTIGPALSHEEGHAVVGVCEVGDGIMQGFRPSVHEVIMKGKIRKSMGRSKWLRFYVDFCYAVRLAGDMMIQNTKNPLAGGL
jgi:hypothetical protein